MFLPGLNFRAARLPVLDFMTDLFCIMSQTITLTIGEGLDAKVVAQTCLLLDRYFSAMQGNF